MRDNWSYVLPPGVGRETRGWRSSWTGPSLMCIQERQGSDGSWAVGSVNERGTSGRLSGWNYATQDLGLMIILHSGFFNIYSYTGGNIKIRKLQHFQSLSAFLLMPYCSRTTAFLVLSIHCFCVCHQWKLFISNINWLLVSGSTRHLYFWEILYWG